MSTTTSQTETNSRPKVDLNKCLVEMRNINKAFGGVHAVENVSINLYPGEVVAVLGHNGAGKSTLMKMLAGAYPIDIDGDDQADVVAYAVVGMPSGDVPMIIDNRRRGR